MHHDQSSHETISETGEDSCLLTCAEMARADAAAIATGITGLELMEAAGQAVAEACLASGSIHRAVVLAGPGNNGGDGWVAARHLMAAGVNVAVMSLVERQSLAGDAAIMADRYQGPVIPFTPAGLAGSDLVVDALFGAGLDRPLTGDVIQLVKAVNSLKGRRVSVDVPSGISGDSGQILGAAVRADLTVTFFRKKPGHVLLPGRSEAGRLVVRDIGIPASVLEDIAPRNFENHPDLWRSFWPVYAVNGHKYHRGHVLVVGGRPPALGASRMTAMAALRAGAGLVTLAATQDSYGIQAGALNEVMVAPFADISALTSLITDNRFSVTAIGPGAGISEDTRRAVVSALGTGRSVVLDADALTTFEKDPARLFNVIKGPTVLTPHAGEFRRLFEDDMSDDKLASARHAARKSGAVTVFKGPDTVIATPEGVTVIDSHGPTHLATAGTGDVLTGLVAGLLAQHMPPWAAAAAAVRLHGDAALHFGRGMIAGDLIQGLPEAMRALDTYYFKVP